jgi:pheromone shutdown-related protein TraB
VSHITPTEWPNTTLVELEGRQIYLVGTAHISQNSVREVEAVISALRPDTVCVELCQTRYDALTDDSRWRKLDIFQVLKQKKALFLMANLALSAYQRRLGEKLGVEPGAELMAGVRKASEVGAKLVLADRDIQITLKRTWANLGFWGRNKILAGLVAGIFGATEELSEDELEKMKDRDTLTEKMKEFAVSHPRVKQPLIDERDLFLISSIREASGDKIVAVVGAGHVPGMLEHLRTTVDRAAISVIPPPGLGSRLAPWLVPALFVGGLIWGIQQRGATEQTLLEMLLAWVVPTSVGAGLGAIAALAHPLTILASILSAPLTTLHPAIAVGMIAAPIEAWKRRPTVADCERIRDDAESLGGWYKNPFLRVLVVFILTNLGASIGVWVGVGKLFGGG